MEKKLAADILSFVAYTDVCTGASSLQEPPIKTAASRKADVLIKDN
jgi:hypothetical protein